MSRPSVSVVLAVYNAAWCIERALDAALAQSLPPVEILVCDDGSSDGTPSLVESRYGAKVRVLRLPHRNASAARREGLAIARGDWLAFLDADDWWTMDKLERQLDWLALNPEVTWLSSDGPYVSKSGVERPSWLSDYFEPVREMKGDLFAPLIHRCFPLMSSMLVERGSYHAVGGIDPAIVYSHDYDLWLRLAARFPGGVMPDPLVYYWTHPGALSKRFENRHRDDLRLMERIARGEMRDEPRLRAAARVRVAGLAFDLGVLCLRTGRPAEGRAFLRGAAVAGPWRRRALALAGSALPDSALPALMKSGWLKRSVTDAKTQPGRLDHEIAP